MSTGVPVSSLKSNVSSVENRNGIVFSTRYFFAIDEYLGGTAFAHTAATKTKSISRVCLPGDKAFDATTR